MSMEGHIEALRRRHAELDEKIHAEEAHVAADNVTLSRLKAEKLRVKEELDRLTAEQR